MERIPLRQYCRDIEDLINNNQSEEALEGCQRVLEIYPHCLDIFRLMGKAHLELREYDKAETAFQKVLSSLPDDFVANLGMSLLREKQTNLNGAIWHMERANEAQLGNTALQNERRRLYKLRDGIGTSRLPSTNGNLIRMYLNGDMLSNAINEINTVLMDDPTRLDVKVLLAQAYFKSGKKEETIQVCRELLKELPYCFEANRILYETRSPAIKIEEMQNLQQRLRELDPYYEFITPDQPDSKKVPDDRVIIEVPDGVGPKTATTGMPGNLSFSSANTGEGMAGSNTMGFGQGNQPPSWMPQPGQDSTTGKAAGTSPATPNSGFNFGKNMTTDDPTSRDRFSSEPDNSPDANQPANPFLSSASGAIPAAEPGDIPEWLKALAAEPPAASSDAITAPLRVPGETGVLQTGEENLDFLRNLGGEADEELPPLPVPEVPPTPATPPSRPTPPVGPIESLPGILPPSPFLTSSETTQPVPLEGVSSEEKPTGRDMPDWLRSAAEPQESEAAVSMESDFRQEFNPVPSEAPASMQMTPINPFEMPEETVTAPVSDEEVPTPEIEQYLEQLRKDITPTDQPDWLKKENLGNDLEALFEEQKPAAPPVAPQAVQPAPVIPSEPEPEQPDWMAQLKEQEVSSPAQPAAPEPSSALPENVPDWLFAPEEEADGSTAPIQSETPVTHQPPPDWLQAARPDIFGRDEFAQEEPAAPAKPDAASDITAAIKDEPVKQPQGLPPELDFLKSESVDFMSADRSHLTDNLTMPPEQPSAVEDVDFTKAAPVENLPADLAALLREETEKQQIHTMPISEESVESLPGFSLELNIPDLKKDFLTEEPPLQPPVEPVPAESDIPFSVDAFMQETAQAEPQKQELPSSPFDFDHIKPVEAPEPEKVEPALNIFAEEAQPTQLEAAPQAGNGYEPETTMPIEEIEVPQTIEPSIFAHEAQPVVPETVQQFSDAFAPETPVPAEPVQPKPQIAVEEVQPVQAEPVAPPVAPVTPEPVKASVMQPTIPVTRLVQEPTIPIPPAPVESKLAVEPVVQEQAPAPAPVAAPQPVIEVPVAAVVEPAPVEEPEPILRTPLPEINLEPIGLSQPVKAVPVIEKPAPVIEPEPVVQAPAPVVEPAPVEEPEPILRTPLPEISLEPIGLSQPIKVEPVVEKPAPVVAPEPVTQAPVSIPQPAVEEPLTAPVPERKPVVPKTIVPKPVVAVKPAAPRPVYRPEKPVVVAQPSSSRKNAGTADLTRAREAAAHGDLATALRRYIKLINSNRALDQVSADLKELTRKNPKNYLAWQTYGDARLRSNRIQEALDAYTKAADLLK
jgi:tetratricopeptide (TPR) repeat protein